MILYCKNNSCSGTEFMYFHKGKHSEPAVIEYLIKAAEKIMKRLFFSIFRKVG